MTSMGSVIEIILKFCLTLIQIYIYTFSHTHTTFLVEEEKNLKIYIISFLFINCLKVSYIIFIIGQVPFCKLEKYLNIYYSSIHSKFYTVFIVL